MPADDYSNLPATRRTRAAPATLLAAASLLALAAPTAVAAQPQPAREAQQVPTSAITIVDFSMYSSASTTALGVSGLSGSTYTFSNLAVAVVSNSTLTGWTYPLTPNTMTLAGRWSTTYATQTATKPVMRLFKSTPAGCFIHKGQSPLCAIDMANQVGQPVVVPLPDTVTSSFTVTRPDIAAAGWTMNADEVYFLRFEQPCQTGSSTGVFAWQLGR